MNIIIKTGFQNILHDIQFQLETVPKGKALVNANHVRNVEEHRRDGESFLIRAEIIRQTSVTSTLYNTKLNINAQRKVIGVSCTCVYNKSGKCKHIAALIHYINNEESLSKTDYEQQWGKPTIRRFVREKYSKGKYFCEMFPSKDDSSSSNKNPCDNNLVNELKDEPPPLRTILLESKKNKNEKAVKFVVDSMLESVDVMLQQEKCASILETVLNLRFSKTVYSGTQIIAEDVKDFYEKEVVKTKRDIIKSCCDTLQQSNCDRWFDIRKKVGKERQ